MHEIAVTDATNARLDFLEKVLAQINARVPARAEVSAKKRETKKWTRSQRATGAITKLEAEFVNEIVADSLEAWPNHYGAERTQIAALLDTLATGGRLGQDEIEEQFENLHNGMTYTLYTGTRAGIPVMEPRERFSDDARLALNAQIAACVLWMAGEGRASGYRVLACAHDKCRRIFLRRPGKGPKSKACPEHVNAYRQARHRISQAAKHK